MMTVMVQSYVMFSGKKKSDMSGSEHRFSQKLQNITEITSVSYTNLLFSQALCYVSYPLALL